MYVFSNVTLLVWCHIRVISSALLGMIIIVSMFYVFIISLFSIKAMPSVFVPMLEFNTSICRLCSLCISKRCSSIRYVFCKASIPTLFLFIRLLISTYLNIGLGPSVVDAQPFILSVAIVMFAFVFFCILYLVWLHPYIVLSIVDIG